MNFWRRISILVTFSVSSLGICPFTYGQGLRGSGEVIPAYLPAELPALQRLLQKIRPNGFDPDLVHEAAETVLVKRALVELTAQILQHFPSSEYDYVSLGRSPSAISIALKEILRMRGSSAEVIELPLSGLRREHFEAGWYAQTLKTHFQNFFYNGQSPKDRKVLVLDYVQKGGTLNNFAGIVELGKAEGWIQRDIHVLGLLNPSVDPRALWLATYTSANGKFPQSHWHTQVLPNVIWPYFYYSSFKHLAEYDGWDFRNHEYEEGVRWSQPIRPGLPGSKRRRSSETQNIEPKISPPRANERKSLNEYLRFWRRHQTERSLYAEDLRHIIRKDQVFASAVKTCHRVHRAD